MKISYPKLIFAGLLTIYFLWVAYDPMQGSFLDMVDLPIHETGHLIFGIFGEFVGMAGGTLFQIILPAVFVGYFWWNEKHFSAAVVLFWVGQSIINVYIYAQDAVTMQLPLVGGGIHDWNWMLTRLGLLDSTKLIAGMIRAVGSLTIIAAASISVFYAFNSPVQEFEEI
jgi:hypothetical protein